MSKAAAKPRAGMLWAFAIIMLALTALFVTLGVWQLQRLAEKETLIARVADRMSLSPVPFPPAAQWAAIDALDYDYLPLSVEGSFEPDATVLVFTSLGEPVGQYGGTGYWMMTPFKPTSGGTVFVNRGFVPDDQLDAVPAPPTGNVTIAGVGRRPEIVNAFTPAADLAKRIEWVRDPERLAQFLPGDAGQIAPITLDLPAAGRGVLPQGGETVVAFPNNHLGYAITWFGFALITPIMLVIWLRRQRVPKPQ